MESGKEFAFKIYEILENPTEFIIMPDQLNWIDSMSSIEKKEIIKCSLIISQKSNINWSKENVEKLINLISKNPKGVEFLSKNLEWWDEIVIEKIRIFRNSIMHPESLVSIIKKNKITGVTSKTKKIMLNELLISRNRFEKDESVTKLFDYITDYFK